jgi:hypothetical protein
MRELTQISTALGDTGRDGGATVVDAVRVAGTTGRGCTDVWREIDGLAAHFTRYFQAIRRGLVTTCGIHAVTGISPWVRHINVVGIEAFGV